MAGHEYARRRTRGAAARASTDTQGAPPRRRRCCRGRVPEVRPQALLREAEAFLPLGVDRIVLTKLDEAVSFGMLVDVLHRIGRELSFVTTGQEVPADIEPASGDRLASMALRGITQDGSIRSSRL